MASRDEFRIRRSSFRGNRQAIKDLIESQTVSLEREYLFTTVLFRGFFLIGGLVLLLIERGALLGAVPFFTIASYVWIYRSLSNNRMNDYAIKSGERLLFDESRRNADFVDVDDDIDRDFVDDLIRIRSIRSDGNLRVLTEPVALLTGALLLILVRLDVYNVLGSFV